MNYRNVAIVGRFRMTWEPGHSSEGMFGLYNDNDAPGGVLIEAAESEDPRVAYRVIRSALRREARARYGVSSDAFT